MMAQGFTPNINDKKTRNVTRASLDATLLALALGQSPPPPGSGETQSLPPPRPAPTQLLPEQDTRVSQEDRDKARKARQTAAALAALDAADDDIEDDEGNALGEDSVVRGEGDDPLPAGKPPTAKQRRAAEAAKNKELKEQEKKAKAAKKAQETADKAASKAAGMAAGKRKRQARKSVAL